MEPGTPPPPPPPPVRGATGFGDLYGEHAERVIARLRRRFHWLDFDDVTAAYSDAVIRAVYDPNFPPPLPRTAAQQLFYWAKDTLRSDDRARRRRKKREEDHADRVTRDEPAALDELERLIQRESAGIARRAIAKTPEEEEVFDLWARRVVKAAEIAEALGRGDDPEAVAAIERMLARFRQRRKRLRDSLDPGGGGADGADDGP